MKEPFFDDASDIPMLWDDVKRYVQIRFRIHPEDAEDITQETFLRAHRCGWETPDAQSIDTVRRAYLRKTAHRVAIDYFLKEQAALKEPLEKDAQFYVDGDTTDAVKYPLERLVAEPTQFEEAAFSQARDRLLRQTSILSPRKRQIVALYEIAGFTYAEIAKELGIRIGTVMGRLHDARKQLTETHGTGYLTLRAA